MTIADLDHRAAEAGGNPDRAAPVGPNRVRYNDWRQLAAPPLDAFEPTLPVSVVVLHFEAPDELARTLAALERQACPRHLFEVVVVDDGSEPPLALPPSSLDLRLVRREGVGFTAAAARNAGARAAAHPILLFLDGDILPEADWLAAHARWHHVVSDALTVGRSPMWRLATSPPRRSATGPARSRRCSRGAPSTGRGPRRPSARRRT